VSQWRKQPVISNYGVPALSVGAVLIVGRWLDLYLHAAPVSLFICAVLFSAWFGGFRPGLLATVLSILAFKYYFVSPIHSLIPETAELPRLIVFSLAALFVGSLTARQQSATEALRESEQRLRDYADAAKAWLWETGPDHAFTQISEEITTLGIDPVLEKQIARAHAMIGAKRWDFATDVEDEPEKWRLHVGTLEAHQPFRGLVYRSASTDGSEVYIYDDRSIGSSYRPCSRLLYDAP